MNAENASQKKTQSAEDLIRSDNKYNLKPSEYLVDIVVELHQTASPCCTMDCTMASSFSIGTIFVDGIGGIGVPFPPVGS